MSEWKSLSSITSKIGSGSTPRGGNSVYSDSGISFIRSQNVLDMDFSTENLAFINDDQAEKLNNVIVEKNDILLNITGDSIARCTVVPEEILPARVNQHVSIIRCKNTEESKYVMYYLQYMKKYLLQISKVGGTRNALTKEAIGKLPIKISDDCNKISKILDNIDQKIQTNNQINQELEAMAKALYDYWFVQFDFPDQNGKPYKSSGGKMVYNPEFKREIPEGWGNSILGEFADLYQPKTISDKDMIEDGEYLVYGANGIIGRYSEYNHEDSMVTISCRGNCGIINITRPYSWITGNSMVVKPKDDIYNIDYISNLLLSLSISSVITGSVQKQLTRTSLVPLKVIIPNKEIIEKYRSITKASFEKRKSIQIEVEQLTQLRDWLLPMLMNGQVKVENYTD